MGRKRKTGLDVCPFDVNMLCDIRMRRLIRLHQGDAVAVYTAVLCLIYRSGYYVGFDEDVCFYLSEQVGVGEDVVRAIIEDAVACCLFDGDVYASSGVLTSQDIQEAYIEERGKTAKRQVALEKYALITEETPQNNDNADKSPQNRDNAEKVPQNTAKCGESSDICPSEAVLPDSAEQSEPVAHNVNITAIDVTDSYDVLELNNNSKANNNLNQEKERKVEKKEKEVELALPYFSSEFVATWNMLRQQPKWKKKTQSALQMSLNKLGKYPEEFAVLLMENAIAGGWQGVVFTWTPDDFRKWQAQQNGVPLQSGNKKPRDIYQSNMESMNEAFRLIDEKYGNEKYGT